MTEEKTSGRIERMTGGFYYLRTGEELLACRARGLFRKLGLSPCVGDLAEAQRTAPGEGYLTGILPRKNALIRPPVANLDLLLLVLAAADPPPNLLVADRMLAVAAHKGIGTAIIVTKADLDAASAERLTEIYERAGYPVRCIDARTDARSLGDLIEGKLCALSGNTGVGKSTLLNALCPELALQTGEISQKLGRGRHTTRTTALYGVCGGLVADTPGFSTLETAQLEIIRKEELADCFPEFAPHQDRCRFTGCSHTKEKGCAVLAAVEAGEIVRSRHESYLAMYEEAKAIREWELPKV